MKNWLVGCIAAVMSVMTVQGATRYVDYVLGEDIGDGTEAPWKTLAHAVANAFENDEIILAKGTHVCTTNLVIDKALHIHGAGENWETVFDAQHKITNHKSPNVKISAAGVLINNLMFYRLCGHTYQNVGCIAVSANSVVSNCVMTACGLSSGGDNAMAVDLAAGTLTCCWITNNVFRYAPVVKIRSAVETKCENCIIANNQIVTANGGPGAVCVNSGTLPVVRNCTIANNTSANGSSSGIGIIYSNGGHPRIYNNIIWGNIGASDAVKNVYTRQWYMNNFVCNDTMGPVRADSADFAINYKPNGWTFVGKECVTIDPVFNDIFGLTGSSAEKLKTGAKTGSDGAYDYCMTYDIYGNPRGDTPSMGAIQYVESSVLSVTIKADRTTARPPETILLTAVVDGAAPENVTYAWDIDGDGEFDDGTDPTNVLNKAGMYNAVKVRVSDGVGMTIGAYDGALTVYLDVAVSATAMKVRQPNVIAFSAVVADAEATQPFIYSWDLDGDGIEDSTEASPVLSELGENVNPTLLKLTDAKGLVSDKLVLTGSYIVLPEKTKTVIVNPGESIVDAIASTYEGDEIVLGVGTHPMTSVIEVNRPITIRGAGAKEDTIIDGNYGNNCHFDVLSDGALVCNLTFKRIGFNNYYHIRLRADAVISNVVVTSCGYNGDYSGTVVDVRAGILTHSWITNNLASRNAGVVMDGNCAMENCAILNNRSTYGAAVDGSALSFPHGSGVRTVKNCTIAGNTFSHTNGVAVYGYCWDASKNEEVRFYNNIVWGNTCTKEGAIHPNVYNGNSKKWIVKNNCWDYNDLQRLQDPEGGKNVCSVLADPQFDAEKGGAPFISRTSPCKNAGDDDYAPTGLDLLSNPRKLGRHVDIGAVEFDGYLGTLFIVK